MRPSRTLLASLLALALVPLLPPTGAADSPAVWTHDDGAPGDVTVDNTPAQGPVPTFGDIQRLTLQKEDELGFEMDIELADFDESGTVTGGDQSLLEVQFALAETQVTYDLKIQIYGGTMPTGKPVIQYAFVREFCVDLGNGCSGYAFTPVLVDPEHNLLKLDLKKAQLRGGVMYGGGIMFQAGPSKDDEPERPTLSVGSKFTDFVMTFHGHTADHVEVTDRMPNDGKITDPFVLAKPTANLDLSVDVITGFNEEYAVVAGQNQTVSFTVSNNDGPKRIVFLSYEFVGTEVSEYRVAGPSNVSVPAHESRSFRAYVFTPATLKPASFVIRARSLALPDIGMAKVKFTEGVALGPESPPLHVLQLQDSSQTTINTCSGCALSYLFPAEEKGNYRAQGELAIPTYNSGLYVPLMGRSANQLAFKPGAAIDLALKVKSKAPQDQTVKVQAFLSYGGQPLLRETKEETITQAGTVLNFHKVPKLNDRVLQSQNTLALMIQLVDYQSPVPVSATSFQDQYTGVVVDLTGTTLQLPFAPIPEEYLEKPLPSPFQVGVLGEREEFVNPGEGRLFNVSVLNYDTKEQRVHLDAKVTPDTWTVEVLPGKLFDLKPGDSVTVGLLVHPGPDAKEGEHAIIRFNASADTGAYSPLSLSAILSTQVQVEDDTGKYVALQDDLEKQRDKPMHKSPDASLAVLLVAVSAMLAISRRLRNNP